MKLDRLPRRQLPKNCHQSLFTKLMNEKINSFFSDGGIKSKFPLNANSFSIKVSPQIFLAREEKVNYAIKVLSSKDVRF